MKKGYLITALTTCLILISGNLMAMASKNSKQKSGAQPPTVVATFTAHHQSYQPSTKAVGSLSAFEGITISPEISGRVTQIYFKSGQFVHKDDPIIQIYPDILRAQLKRAQSQLRLSQLNYRRFYQLYKKGFYDKADLDKSYTTVETDKANVAEIQAQLNQTLIKAPFTGKLGLREISIGDYLSAGKGIVSLQQIDPLRADFSIPERYLDQIQIGNKISARSRSLPNKTYQGTIYAFNSIIDQNTRTLDMRAKIANPAYKLLPGMFIELNVYLGEAHSVIIIPQTAIIYSRENNTVYRVIDNKAVKTDVTVGEKLVNNQIIIEKGLNEGDVVITDGLQKVHDGSPVTEQQNLKKKTK